MNRWLLNTFSTWQLGLIVVGGLVLLALVGMLAVRRIAPHWQDGPYNDVAGVVLGLVAAVYGIVLAFVIVALYEDYKDAEGVVHGEATALAQVYQATKTLPIAARMREEVSAYASAVRIDEWPRMRDGEGSVEAARHLDEMYDVVAGYEPTTNSQTTFYGDAVGGLDELVGARRERLAHAAEDLPASLEVLLVGGALMLIAFLYLLGLPSLRAQTAMVLAVSALVGFNLLIALLLDHPFSGDVAVSNAPFQQGSLENVSGGLEHAHP
jgi:hypothetical protein